MPYPNCCVTTSHTISEFAQGLYSQKWSALCSGFATEGFQDLSASAAAALMPEQY